MTEWQQELFEKQLGSISRGLEYPPTPNISGAVMARLRPPARTRAISKRFVWTLTVVVVLFASLLLIPPARAAILDLIQIGIVRIFRVEPTPPQQQFPATSLPVTATPSSTPQALIPILERLAGELTLEEAQQTVPYPILIPSYPSDLGPPDRVFVQDAEGDMTIMVWIDPQDPTQILMSLHMIPPESWAIDKMDPALIRETTVNRQRAIWAVGPYPLRFSNGDLDFVRLIEGHVLIWKDGEITYRLETNLSLEEATKVAEALTPLRR